MASLMDNIKSILGGFMPNRTVGPDYKLTFMGEPSLVGLNMNRVDRYARNRARLNNTFYNPSDAGGYREDLIKNTFKLEDDILLTGMYNPVSAIVETYQNVFRGKWGNEIRPADTIGGPTGKPVNPKLLDPLAKIWRMSNMSTNKQVKIQHAANYGMVGLRIVAKPESNRVFIQPEHPSNIVDFDEDERGNIKAIKLQYYVEAGPLGDRDFVLVDEEITKDRFIRKMADKRVPTDVPEVNELGVCPYVVLRHRNSEKWGQSAYDGSEPIIDALNLLFCNISESVHEAIWATWVAIASGEEPTNVRIGRHTLAYIKQEVDGPTPSLQPMAAKLDFEGAVALGVTLIDQLVQRQPELLLTHIKALSGQSGETIAKLQTAAVSRIEGAMAIYEDALTRAMQIAASLGVLYNMWDLGSGMGTRQAADTAYNTGLEDFEFIDRAPTPETIYDKYQRAKYDQAAGMAKAEVAAKIADIVPLREQLRTLFPLKPEAEIDKLAKEKEEENKANQPVVKPGQQAVRNASGQNGSLDGGILNTAG